MNGARPIGRQGTIARAIGTWLTAAATATAGAPAAAGDTDVPFVVTPDRVTIAMLEIAATGPGDHVVDLGSGDGRIVVTAARRFGATGLGVELVPELVERSRAAARAAGVERRVEFRVADLFATDLSPATVVTMYLLPEVNLQLRPRLQALAPGTRIVSHDWDLGDWAPDRTLTIDVAEKTIGRERVSRVHLWVVPARVVGVWCAPGRRLELAQRFQRFSAVLTDAASPAGAPPKVFDGRIDGVDLQPQPSSGVKRLRVDAAGDSIGEPGTGADGAVARYRRSADGRCAP